MHWNYSEESDCGPSQWSKYFAAAGQSQSPIDILVDPCELQCSTGAGAGAGATAAASAASPLAEQLASRLNIRTHLNSAGDHHQHHQQHDERRIGRSPSTSSAESSSSSTTSSSQEDSSKFNSRTAHLKSNLHSNSINHHHHHHHRHPQKTRYCLTNKKIFLGYPRYLNAVQLCNTGHAWQVNLPAELAHHTLLTGPPLADREYRLAQFHCHWGQDCQSGSEHRINGRTFGAELHFVHWNCSQFRSLEEASQHRHGLAVLAVLVEAHQSHPDHPDHQNNHHNKHLEKILARLPEVTKPDSSVRLTQAKHLDLKKLFPSNKCHYATYEGSLTTPPLSEVVDWIVFLEPIHCSSQQVEQFRRLQCQEGNLLSNCRPVQPVNDRLVSIWSHAGNHHHHQMDQH